MKTTYDLPTRSRGSARSISRAASPRRTSKAGRRGPAARIRRPGSVRGRSRHPADRRHRPRRGRGRHRALERGRRLDARRPRGHRAGGRRRASDRRIVLNAALFERHGVTVAGAVVNKVDLDAKPGLARTLEQGLDRHGIPLLGVLPFRRSCPTRPSAMVLEGVQGETLHPGPDLTRSSVAWRSARWSPSTCSNGFGPGSLVIVPGDRADVIGAIVEAQSIGGDETAATRSGSC